jgi:hypothetical protein
LGRKCQLKRAHKISMNSHHILLAHIIFYLSSWFSIPLRHPMSPHIKAHFKAFYSIWAKWNLTQMGPTDEVQISKGKNAAQSSPKKIKLSSSFRQLAHLGN